MLVAGLFTGMKETNFTELETLFLALGDKTRLRLLALMADGEVAVGFLADRLGESQPKVSRHLAYLRNADVVYTRRDGKWIYYGISYPEDPSLRQILVTVIRSIAVMRIDGEFVYFTGEDAYTEQIFSPHDNVYVKTDMYELENDYEQRTKVSAVDPDSEPEGMDVFLL